MNLSLQNSSEARSWGMLSIGNFRQGPGTTWFWALFGSKTSKTQEMIGECRGVGEISILPTKSSNMCWFVLEVGIHLFFWHVQFWSVPFEICGQLFRTSAKQRQRSGGSASELFVLPRCWGVGPLATGPWDDFVTNPQLGAEFHDMPVMPSSLWTWVLGPALNRVLNQFCTRSHRKARFLEPRVSCSRLNFKDRYSHITDMKCHNVCDNALRRKRVSKTNTSRQQVARSQCSDFLNLQNHRFCLIL